mmetsp:Transcript_2672/g.6364  ORF Transcript_2672/g.6364 Transcript_2672/m.6364 type:complete len:295 (-) Transcript_2672:309-1193(-)
MRHLPLSLAPGSGTREVHRVHTLTHTRCWQHRLPTFATQEGLPSLVARCWLTVTPNTVPRRWPEIETNLLFDLQLGSADGCLGMGHPLEENKAVATSTGRTSAAHTRVDSVLLQRVAGPGFVARHHLHVRDELSIPPGGAPTTACAEIACSFACTAPIESGATASTQITTVVSFKVLVVGPARVCALAPHAPLCVALPPVADSLPVIVATPARATRRHGTSTSAATTTGNNQNVVDRGTPGIRHTAPGSFQNHLAFVLGAQRDLRAPTTSSSMSTKPTLLPTSTKKRTLCPVTL